MTTDKVKKLYRLAKSPNKHEAAAALAKAQALEFRTAKGVAKAIAKLLEDRGLTVCVRRLHGTGRRNKADAVVQYVCSQRQRMDRRQFAILITEYDPAARRKPRIPSRRYSSGENEPALKETDIERLSR